MPNRHALQENAESGYDNTTEESGKNEDDENMSEIDKGDKNNSKMQEGSPAAPEAAPEGDSIRICWIDKI